VGCKAFAQQTFPRTFREKVVFWNKKNEACQCKFRKFLFLIEIKIPVGFFFVQKQKSKPFPIYYIACDFSVKSLQRSKQKIVISWLDSKDV